jgi:hypothetical protein
MGDSTLHPVQVLACFPKIPVYQCNECPYWKEVPQDFCFRCPTIIQQWRIDFHLREFDISLFPQPETQNISAVGSVLDLVMGMTFSQYQFLRDHWPTLDDYVRLFFNQSIFYVNRVLVKIDRITLAPGCQLNFLNWLGMQPGFDIDELKDLLMTQDFELESDPCDDGPVIPSKSIAVSYSEMKCD